MEPLCFRGQLLLQDPTFGIYKNCGCLRGFDKALFFLPHFRGLENKNQSFDFAYHLNVPRKLWRGLDL